ncbi:hypothetical protein [Microbulbifer aggregans]|uniref:hypothetical protein n=1 Tax=Microbulbifer aggregans TaxID=1769779 RepID=UPI0009F4F982|nr:hypothetical protein [Microbulbifer aggregans]
MKHQEHDVLIRGSKRKVLAASSTGGHWVELLRLQPSWQEHNAAYLTCDPALQKQVSPSPFFVVTDANMKSKIALIKLCIQVFRVIYAYRPDVVISTGAAPGFFAVFWGKIFGAKTVWIDSVANIDQLSLSGRKAKFFSDVWLSQWPDLAGDEGPQFRGRVF